MACLTEETVLAFVKGGLSPTEIAPVEEHLAGCGTCRAVVAEVAQFLADADPAAPRASHEEEAEERQAGQSIRGPRRWLRLPSGTQVSRYVVLEPLGAGGAGIVYVAQDPQLRRRIALKLVPVEANEAARARWLREAQAMAQVAHPNVVHIYDSGIHEGHVFIAMELVQGRTLTDWVAERERGWREILSLFLDAGRGLAAAHEAKLVHRDFKPENVLIGADGRPRVSDFGLARPLDEALFAEPLLDAAEALATSPPHLTVAGTVLGTPIYMAPEQLLGGDVDMRSDQFSFCVALYVALYRQRPFDFPPPQDNEGLRALAKAIIAGPVRPPPADTTVPPAVHRMLLRGLAADPARRHASMDELLRVLASELAGRRWPRARVLVAAGLIVVLALIGVAGRKRLSALVASCGNGHIETGEECDDGNRSDADACLASCLWSACGDGKVRSHVEECDDGNQRDGDGCSATCLACTSPDGAFEWSSNGHCYTRHDGPLTWNAARAYCVAHGGDLVTYAAAPETSSVFRALLSDGVEAWVGFSRDKFNVYRWVNQEAVTTLWGSSHATVDPDAGCAFQQPRNPKHQGASDALMNWTTAPCDETRAFVCERWAPPVRPSDRHAYRAIYRPLDWDDAARACRGLAGHLTIVDDAEEQGLLATQVPGDVWLGASDRKQEGDFRWLTGRPLVPAFFAAGEPDNANGNQNCLILNEDRLWHDRICEDVHGFVCEIP